MYIFLYFYNTDFLYKYYDNVFTHYSVDRHLDCLPFLQPLWRPSRQNLNVNMHISFNL